MSALLTGEGGYQCAVYQDGTLPVSNLRVVLKVFHGDVAKLAASNAWIKAYLRNARVVLRGGQHVHSARHIPNAVAVVRRAVSTANPEKVVSVEELGALTPSRHTPQGKYQSESFHPLSKPWGAITAQAPTSERGAA